jgi:hypothetical protein
MATVSACSVAGRSGPDGTFHEFERAVLHRNLTIRASRSGGNHVVVVIARPDAFAGVVHGARAQLAPRTRWCAKRPTERPDLATV